jgi:hypothetical protein
LPPLSPRSSPSVVAVGTPFILEDLAPRPLVDMPAPVLADMESSQVSIFAVQVQANELRSRMQMTDVVNRRHMRHAHMVNITPEIMCTGMRADFDLVDRLSPEGARPGPPRTAHSRHDRRRHRYYR